jgi:A/G-specific adenine glycosylase
MNFQKELITWYLQHKRELPWRNTTDPYVIWLSEIILQQTRVEQGLPYFIKFLEAFPTVAHFANATEDQVLKLWQGLGYYSRGRNMLVTAKQVVTEYEGKFPTQYVSLISLKGIGEYTAAAISSFAANEAKAVLDGNVFRLLARYFGIEEAINSTLGKKIFSKLANELIEGQQPSSYNQAIMEFGALQCKPKSPLCNICPLQLGCYARINKKVEVLPLKLKTVKIKTRWFNYFVAQQNEHILIKQRTPGDVWQQLYDFPLIETSSDPQTDFADFKIRVQEAFGKEAKITSVSQKKHILTHQIIYVHFFALDNYMFNFNPLSAIKLVPLQEFKELPHPKVIEEFAAKYLKI